MLKNKKKFNKENVQYTRTVTNNCLMPSLKKKDILVFCGKNLEFPFLFVVVNFSLLMGVYGISKFLGTQEKLKSFEFCPNYDFVVIS